MFNIVNIVIAKFIVCARDVLYHMNRFYIQVLKSAFNNIDMVL